MTTTNRSERKFVSLFNSLRKGGPKAEVAAGEYRDLRNRGVDAELGALLDQWFRDFRLPKEQRPKPTPEILAGWIEIFRDRGLAQLLALVGEEWSGVLGKLSVAEILPLALDAATLEAWRDAAALPGADLEARLLADPVAAYATAGADWLLERGQPGKLAPLLSLFLARNSRPKWLADWASAISGALKRDKRGLLLQELLKCGQESSAAIAAMAEVIRLDQDLWRQVYEALPELLVRPDAPVAAAQLVEQVGGEIAATVGDEREFRSAILARLGSGIVLTGQRSPAGEAALALIARQARSLRNLAEAPALAGHTWVFENLVPAGEKTGGRLQVTLDGARDVALALQKVAQGFPGGEVLRVTARNLGLLPFGKPGEVVVFRPLQHADEVGGLLPGDPAVIEAEGWTHGTEVVLRARVGRQVAGV